MRAVVGVVRGGRGSEYEHSLKSGAHILQNLDKEKYEPRDIFIDRSNIWHLGGVPVLPEAALRGTDVALNSLYGAGALEVQQALDKLGVAYGGSRPSVAALANDTLASKSLVSRSGILVPRRALVDTEVHTDLERAAFELFRSFPQPSVVLNGDEPIVADNFRALQWGMERAAKESPKILIEEYIKGTPADVGVIDNFRGEETYSLIPQASGVSRDQMQALESAAKKVHKALGLSHYSHAQFVVNKRGVYFAGVSANPSLAPQSQFIQALEGVGAKLTHFLDHVIFLAKAKR